jgi:hypothetical protein
MILIPEIKSPVIRTQNDTTYTLSNASVDYDIDVPDIEVIKSVINGDQAIINRGDYFNGSIDYFGISQNDYIGIKALQGSIVRLWPFGTGLIPNTNTYYPYVDVILTSIQPYHRNKKYYIDACILNFVSVHPYSLALATDTGVPEYPEQ